MNLHFDPLYIKRITPEVQGSVVVTFAVPPDLRDRFAFTPGQFLTLRAAIDGAFERRSYSICSSPARYQRAQELDVGIKRVPGGVFSNHAATHWQVGDEIDVMPPQGRFTPRVVQAGQPVQRLGLAAGSGITPLLSIISHVLETESNSGFTLVYGNQRVNTILFSEALQDLKDRYPSRLSLIHVLSRQPQEATLFNGRLDADKLAALFASGLLPAPAQLDEAFVCGPSAMLEACVAALQQAGLPPERVHAERFVADGTPPPGPLGVGLPATEVAHSSAAEAELEVVIDGKAHRFAIGPHQHVLDVALNGGLELPYSCRGGVCCTCRAKLLEGQVHMDKNFTLEPWEMAQGFVLTCQARALTPRVVLSYDER